MPFHHKLSYNGPVTNGDSHSRQKPQVVIVGPNFLRILS